jgi:uncharacterized protein (DUF58 family)
MPRDPLDERVLLTRDDRAFLAGNADVADPNGRRHDLRYNARRRARALSQEIALLREHGEEEFADEMLEELARIVVAHSGDVVQTRLGYGEK